MPWSQIRGRGSSSKQSTSAEAARRRVKRRYGFFALLAAAGLIAFGASVKTPDYWPYVIAAILGVLLAITELVARYRDDPASAVLSTPAAVYVLVNAMAAAGALCLLHVFNWTFGLDRSELIVTQVLTAGFGSAALFRTSLFNVATGDQIIGVGPSAILNVILTAADRAVDRQRAIIRAAMTSSIMEKFSFNRGAETLLAYCIATMQNITATEAKAVENRISELRDPKNKAMPDQVKSNILGLQLLTLVGGQVLTQAKDHVENALLSQGERVQALLRQNGGEIPIQQLREQSRLELSEISSLLDDLQARNVITFGGKAGDESVKLAAGQ